MKNEDEVEYQRLDFALLQTEKAAVRAHTDACVPARNTFEAARTF